MSILDAIANPQIPNYLQGIQVMDQIQNNRVTREMNQIRAGKYLQDIMASRQAMANQAKGSQVIQNFLSGGSSADTASASGPQIPAGAPTPDQQTVANAVRPFTMMHTSQIKNAQNLTDLGNALMAIPGNEKRAKQFYDVADQIYKRIDTETPQDWNQAQTLLEATGNQFERISNLEDAGKFGQAKKLFDQTREMMMNDSRLQGNQYAADFYNHFSQYQPGMGKYLYNSTMMGQKVRDQYLQDKLAYGKDVETVSMGLFDKNYDALDIKQRQAVLNKMMEMKKPGVVINMPGAKAFEKSLGTLGAKQFLAERDGATTAAQGLNSINEAKKLIDSGIISGFGANFITNMGKALRRVGINVAENDVDNTNAFIAAQAQQVAHIIKQFGAGTGLSDADRVFATKAAGGDITLTEGAIRKIMDINQRAYTSVIKLYNSHADKIPAGIIPYDLHIKMPGVQKITIDQRGDELQKLHKDWNEQQVLDQLRKEGYY